MTYFFRSSECNVTNTEIKISNSFCSSGKYWNTYQGQFHKDHKGLWLTIDSKQPPQPVPRKIVGAPRPRLHERWDRSCLSGWSSPCLWRCAWLYTWELNWLTTEIDSKQMKYCRRNMTCLEISLAIFPLIKQWKMDQRPAFCFNPSSNCSWIPYFNPRRKRQKEDWIHWPTESHPIEQSVSQDQPWGL